MLQKKRVTPTLPDYQSVVKMYHEAFPANEQLPLWYLQFLTLRRGISFSAYYDDDQIVGMIYTTKTQNTIFVLYLATNARIRSRGYGTKILQQLIRETPNQEIVLNIEPQDVSADNADQRAKRLRFYQKNGFMLTGYVIEDSNQEFDILSTSNHFSIVDYKRAVKKLSFGFQKVTVNPKEN
ncbi:GNAT family N-acetyltransferase [Weissella confusa]|uniref:GNAT family N-acetyltransferase n=1 Tax=Weissella confusa TaxID=1583 RepID=UPI00223B3C36|nr:GNAT family N-acetyltransferase [Weissella confusa]MCT0007655.1 GNAT family N-acetyltransferase [Weissella confusa]